jgi:hypothetical protein
MTTNVSRNELLKIWCDKEYGRASKLGKLVFSHHSYPHLSISNYKSGRKISDKLWNTLLEKMEEIEQAELNTQVDLHNKVRKPDFSLAKESLSNEPNHYNIYGWGENVHEHSYDDVRQQQFKSITKQWLMRDEIAKLRMIDLAYVANYVEGGTKDLHSTYVSTILKKGLPVSIDDENRIYKLMNHIDDLIQSRHTFYVAASLNTEAAYY